MLAPQHQHDAPEPAPPPLPHLIQPQSSAPRHADALAAAHIAFASSSGTTTADALRRSASQRSAAGYTTTATMLTSSATAGQEPGSSGGGGLLRRRHSFRRTLRREEPVVAASKRMVVGRIAGGLGARVVERVGGGQKVGVVPARERRSEAGPSTGPGRSPFAGFGVRKTRSMYGWSGIRAGEVKDGPSFSATPKPSIEHRTSSPKRWTGPKEETASRPGPPVLDASVDSAPEPTLPTREDEEESIRVRRVRKRSSLLLLAAPFKNRGSSGENTRISDVPQQPPEEEGGAMGGTGSRKVSWASSRRSEGLRDKLRRYFRRASGGSTTTTGTAGDGAKLPPQQVEASRLHFGEGRPSAALFAAGLTAETAASSVAAVPFGNDTPPTLAEILQGGMEDSSSLSDGTARSKSRVTSWADSTIAGTVAESAERLSIIAEDDLLNGSAPRLYPMRTAPSCKASEAEEKQRLSGSATSMGGSFLRKLIRRPTSDSNKSSLRTEDDTIHEEKPFGGHTVYDTLPSQRRRASFVSITSWRNKATVRTVAASSDIAPAEEDKQEAVSARTEALQTGEQQPTLVESVDENPRPLSRAVRYSGITKYAVAPLPAPVPSTAQREARGARAENRWQSPLEEKRSLFFPHSPASPSRSPVGRKLLLAATAADGGSMPVTPSRPKEIVFEPPVGLDDDEDDDERDQGFRMRLEALREPVTPRGRPAMSPSVYSRATDDSTNTSPTLFGKRAAIDYSPVATSVVPGPADEVIITSHRRHSAAAPEQRLEKKPPSGDWCAWLASEVEHFAAESEALDGLRGDMAQDDKGKAYFADHRREHAQIEEDGDSDAVAFATARMREGPTVKQQQPCASALRDAASHFGLPVAERRAGGASRSSGIFEHPGGRTPSARKTGLYQYREAAGVSHNDHHQQAVMMTSAVGSAATSAASSHTRRNAENRPPRPRSRRAGSAAAEAGIMNDRFPMMSEGGATPSRLPTALGMRSKRGAGSGATTPVASVGDLASRRRSASPATSTASIISPAHFSGGSFGGEGTRSSGILTPRGNALPLRVPARSVAALGQLQTPPRGSQGMARRGAGASPASVSSSAGAARAGKRVAASSAAEIGLAGMSARRGGIGPPAGAGATASTTARRGNSHHHDVATGSPGERGSSSVGSTTPTGGAGRSLATLASEMTLLQILRGPYRGVIAGESCESLVGPGRDVGEEGGVVVERDSPGKRMAERWLSERERGVEGGRGAEVEMAFL